MTNPIRILDRLLARLALALIHLYQALGPIKRFFLLAPSPCRYQPTCSHYALESFQAHPFPKALYLSIRRILRCHPFSKGGYDPVPPPKD
ncbi:MAG: membrane protein insertion efficiency factor YidD [bacterium]|nr:membrane protein insertion efficiency factor YidD [bacterium]